MEECNVDLGVDVNAFVNEHALDGQALGSSLMRDQIVAEHLAGEVSNLLGRLQNLNAAFQSRVEVALASAPCMDLGLQDQTSFVRKALGDFEGAFSSGG